jgi:hypothetical protein
MLRIEDIAVELDECGHCGLAPTKLDAKKVIETIRKSYGGPCPACGLKVGIKSISLQHANRSGKKRGSFWKPMCVELKGAIGMEIYGYRRTWIHEACVERLFGRRIKRGEVWRPWNEDSAFVVTGG